MSKEDMGDPAQQPCRRWRCGHPAAWHEGSDGRTYGVNWCWANNGDCSCKAFQAPFGRES